MHKCINIEKIQKINRKKYTKSYKVPSTSLSLNVPNTQKGDKKTESLK